ncbi:MAG: acyltransferase [Fluviicola sp. XM-24bin1]|nr:MAG: acyltransferase [Fluviicola sp. XM-24bin1]
MRKFYRFLLRMMGWKIDETTPENIKQCVIVVGPHTSNWDFIIGKLAFKYYGVKVKFLIKKEAFFFPFGYLLKWMGGIPVDRKKNNNLTDYAVQLFQEHEVLFLTFTPEGTRSYSPNWKKGFYYIAQKANVPIYIAYIDYENKIGGFHSVLEPSGDLEADIMHIKRILSKYKGKVPENGIREE